MQNGQQRRRRRILCDPYPYAYPYAYPYTYPYAYPYLYSQRVLL